MPLGSLKVLKVVVQIRFLHASEVQGQNGRGVGVGGEVEHHVKRLPAVVLRRRGEQDVNLTSPGRGNHGLQIKRLLHARGRNVVPPNLSGSRGGMGSRGCTLSATLSTLGASIS